MSSEVPVTLRRALTLWLVFHLPGKARTTRRFYWQTVKQIRRAWHSRLSARMEEISSEDVARFASTCGHYCPSRWNAMLSVLHSTVAASRILKRRPLKLTRPPPPSPEEFARLMREAESLTRSHAAEVIDFLAHSGLRITAAKNVRWTAVHEDRIEYTGKGGKLCSVPIINGMSGVLERLRKLDDGSGFVLPRGTIKKGLAKACDRAGLRRLNHHDFRHLFTTRCTESGVDIPTVARWRGDSDGGAMLMKRYFHLLDRHSQAMAARVRI